MQKISSLTDLVYFYDGKPVEFAYDLVLTEDQILDPQQIEVLEALEEHRYLSIRSGHGVGKTTLLAIIVLYLMFVKLSPLIPCTAPTKRQLDIGIMPAIKKWYNQSKLKPLKLFNWQKTSFELNNSEKAEEWRVIPFSASEPDNAAGLHSPTIALLVDEAPGVDDEMFEVLDGALTTDDVYFVMTGNPTQNSGFFYESHHDPKLLKKFKTFTLSSEKSSLVKPKWINSMKEKYGEDSNIYSIRVKGEHAKELLGGYIKLHLIEKAYNRDAERSNKAYHGLDVGGSFEGDPSKIYSRIGYQMTEKNTFNYQDTMLLVPEIRILLSKYSDKENFIIMDRTGIGHGLWNRLTELSQSFDPAEKINATIIGIHFGEKAIEDPEIIKGVYTELWENTNKLLMEGKPGIIEDPEDRMLEFELTNRIMKINDSSRKMVIESKKDYMKRTKKGSPNDGDAFNLCFFEPVLMASVYSYGESEE